MLPNKTVLSLTMDLLASQAFNHLKDSEISALHHLILKLQEPLTQMQKNLLLGFWRHANTAVLSPALLHRCNTVLLQHGQYPMEEMMMEMELY